MIILVNIISLKLKVREDNNLPLSSFLMTQSNLLERLISPSKSLAIAICDAFILNITFVPISIFESPKLQFSFDILIPAIIAWIVMGISALLVIFFSKLFHWSKDVTGGLLLVAILTNSSIMGIPIINAYLGEEALPYVLIYDQLGTFIALAVYGAFITAFYSSNSNLSFKLIIQKIITFPSFLALLFALLFLGKTFHPMITSILTTFANTLIPVALVAVGLQLQFKLPKDDIKPLSIALLIKLIIASKIDT